ncbi:MAG: CHASE2 domain-containing protein, partial [Comamonadaceae bacterium]
MSMLTRVHHRTQLRRREWGLLSVLLLALVAWLSAPGSLDRLNFLIQDAGLRLQARPGHPDIVLVTIDDRSVEAVGRWPWRRVLHAQLLSQISAQSPRAIGLDVLFHEPDADYPGDDALLARAIRASGRVVLPVVRRSQTNGGATDLPLPQLARNASQLGHVHVDVDPDGVTRRLFLQEGPAAAWPHFSVALRCAEGAPLNSCHDGRSPPPPDAAWQKAEPRIIAFAAGAAPFTTYSYVDVLKGHVPTDAFTDKYVLIGATATGLGDMFAAPVGPQARRVPGVELLAHVLGSELEGIRIRPAPALW